MALILHVHRENKVPKLMSALEHEHLECKHGLATEYVFVLFIKQGSPRLYFKGWLRHRRRRAFLYMQTTQIAWTIIWNEYETLQSNLSHWATDHKEYGWRFFVVAPPFLEESNPCSPWHGIELCTPCLLALRQAILPLRHWVWSMNVSYRHHHCRVVQEARLVSSKHLMAVMLVTHSK